MGRQFRDERVEAVVTTEKDWSIRVTIRATFWRPFRSTGCGSGSRSTAKMSSWPPFPRALVCAGEAHLADRRSFRRIRRGPQLPHCVVSLSSAGYPAVGWQTPSRE